MSATSSMRTSKNRIPRCSDGSATISSASRRKSDISVRQAILFGKLTGNFRWPFRKGAEETESYDRMFRAMNIQYCIDGVLRDRDRPLGQIVLFRQPEDGDFDGEEERVLARTLPYIAHAISSPVKTPEAFVETGDSGLMVFDATGKVTYQSRLAKELCVYALHERIPVGQDTGLDSRAVEAGLQSLFSRCSRTSTTPMPCKVRPRGH